MSAGALPTLLYRMTDGSPGVRSAAARCLRNVTASASKEIKRLVAHNGGAKACIGLLTEVCDLIYSAGNFACLYANPKHCLAPEQALSHSLDHHAAVDCGTAAI